MVFPFLSLDGIRTRWGRLDPVCCVASGYSVVDCWMGFGRRIFVDGLWVWQPPLVSPHLHQAKAVFPWLLRLACGGCFYGSADCQIRGETARSAPLATTWGSSGGSGEAGAVGWIQRVRYGVAALPPALVVLVGCSVVVERWWAPDDGPTWLLARLVVALVRRQQDCCTRGERVSGLRRVRVMSKMLRVKACPVVVRPVATALAGVVPLLGGVAVDIFDFPPSVQDLRVKA